MQAQPQAEFPEQGNPSNPRGITLVIVKLIIVNCSIPSLCGSLGMLKKKSIAQKLLLCYGQVTWERPVLTGVYIS